VFPDNNVSKRMMIRGRSSVFPVIENMIKVSSAQKLE
jgi:hypothetical protein